MAVKLGIGVTTFNRCRKLEICISRLQELNSQPFHLFVADDGSDDGTVSVCTERKVPFVSSPNMGIAWNKNRALFFLHRILECDVSSPLRIDGHANR